jgi:hypothetical protein
VKDYLPLIQTAFDELKFIAIEANKKKQVTLFLLAYLQQHISDTRVQRQIQQTLEIVRQRTGN